MKKRSQNHIENIGKTLRRGRVDSALQEYLFECRHAVVYIFHIFVIAYFIFFLVVSIGSIHEAFFPNMAFFIVVISGVIYVAIGIE